MAAPLLYAVNRLEEGTVTVSGSETGFGAERLSDRNIRRQYRDSAGGSDRNIPTLDLGVGVTKTVSAVIVGPGHNLSGVLLKFFTSTDAVAFTERDSFTPSGSAAFRRVIAGGPYTTRAYRLLATAPASAPILTEVFFTDPLTLPRGPTEGEGGTFERLNLVTLESPAGHVSTQKLGEARWECEYLIRDLQEPSERDALRTLLRTSLDHGSKKFWLVDHEGTLRYVRWLEDLAFSFVPVLRNNVVLRFQEALA